MIIGVPWTETVVAINGHFQLLTKPCYKEAHNFHHCHSKPPQVRLDTASGVFTWLFTLVEPHGKWRFAVGKPQIWMNWRSLSIRNCAKIPLEICQKLSSWSSQSSRSKQQDRLQLTQKMSDVIKYSIWHDTFKVTVRAKFGSVICLFYCLVVTVKLR